MARLIANTVVNSACLCSRTICEESASRTASDCRKGGISLRPTKRGKGTKLTDIADASGFPLAVHTASAGPHEITLVAAAVDATLSYGPPRRPFGDRAYDSDSLDEILAADNIELIAPYRSNRKHATQGGRPLRRYKRRRKVERLFA